MAGPMPCLDFEEFDIALSIESSGPTGNTGMMSRVHQNYDPRYNSPVSEYEYRSQQHQYLSDYFQTGRNSKDDEQLEDMEKWQENKKTS